MLALHPPVTATFELVSKICISQWRWLAVAALSVPILSYAAAPDKRPLTFLDLAALHRISSPQLSADGKYIAYVVTDADLKENQTKSDIWILSTTGGEPRRLTASPKQDRHPTWSPDGKWIAFESNREGEDQVYVVSAAGGKAKRLTSISTGASQPVWSPAGNRIAFVSSVFPEYSERAFSESDPANKERLDQAKKSKVKARIYTQLLYRHWNSWNDGRRQHLFVARIEGDRLQGFPQDVTPGPRDAVPNSSTFSVEDEFAFSPDGRELAYTTTPSPTREEAWDTNHDLWAVDLTTGGHRALTSNPAADGCPHYSPDGKWLAYRAQKRRGFEADQWQLMLLERVTGQIQSLTETWDASIEDITWAPDSSGLVVTAEDGGTKRLWRLPVAGGMSLPLTSGGTVADARVAPDGKQAYAIRASISQPAELVRVPMQGGLVVTLHSPNVKLIGHLDLPPAASVTVPGSDGTPTQMWILRPPQFQIGTKYPLVFWVHGGPQSAFLDSWSYRWNAQLWAAQGYIVAMPNPRGSTGFGQRFTDEISRDWGGKVFEDLMACLGYLEKLPEVDSQRMAAAGASYGGYMMNWFQGHTDKFKTIVTHCGVFDFNSMYGATEELWFEEWDHGIPWRDADFGRWSPHQFAGRFRTPNLVIHNENDFRVPINQGLALFTTLQRQGIPSKLLIFPDEGHWVLKPQNSELWHRTIFEWLSGYLKP